MERPKNQRKLIPDWFGLKKYQETNKATVVDWALNIYVRSTVREFLTQTDDTPPLARVDSSDFEKLKSLIFQKGFLYRSDLQDLYDDIRNPIIDSMRAGCGLVYNLPLVTAFNISVRIQRDTRLRHKLAVVKDRNIVGDSKREPVDATDQSLVDWYEKRFLFESFCDRYKCRLFFPPSVCVDLDASDEAIVSSFREWLASERKKHELAGFGSIEKSPSQSMIDRWRRNAVLPYLDLEIHQMCESVEIPLHVIGEAIFPASSQIDTTEAVRKTTRPLAERLSELAWTNLNDALRQELIQSSGKESSK